MWATSQTSLAQRGILRTITESNFAGSNGFLSGTASMIRHWPPSPFLMVVPVQSCLESGSFVHSSTLNLQFSRRRPRVLESPRLWPCNSQPDTLRPSTPGPWRCTSITVSPGFANRLTHSGSSLRHAGQAGSEMASTNSKMDRHEVLLRMAISPRSKPEAQVRQLTTCGHASRHWSYAPADPASSAPPSGRKYCVPRMGSLTRRSNFCRSSLCSTKSISEVFTTSRSEAL